MRSIDNDLPIASYALIGVLVIAHEAIGLHRALMLGAGLVVCWVALWLVVALVVHLCKMGNSASVPPK